MEKLDTFIIFVLTRIHATMWKFIFEKKIIDKLN